MNIRGSINLLKLQRTGVATIKGKRCVVIPVDENDIYISADEDLKAKGAYLNIDIYATRQYSETGQADEYGRSHYSKQSFSKQYRDTHPDIVEERKKVYLGDFKPNDFVREQPQIQTPDLNVDDDSDLPF